MRALQAENVQLRAQVVEMQGFMVSQVLSEEAEERLTALQEVLNLNRLRCS